MARVGRVPSNKREFYLGTYGQPGSHTEEFEFREEDVWSTVDSEEQGGSRFQGFGREWGTRGYYESSRTATIPRESRQMGGLSLVFEKEKTASSRSVQEEGCGGVPLRRHQLAASAPVNVPDWDRILRVKSIELTQEPDEGAGGAFLAQHQSPRWDPPHEYLARSRRSAATCAFEGVGRTLKGREMSRLRDTVWSQTGFYG